MEFGSLQESRESDTWGIQGELLGLNFFSVLIIWDIILFPFNFLWSLSRSFFYIKVKEKCHNGPQLRFSMRRIGVTGKM